MGIFIVMLSLYMSKRTLEIKDMTFRKERNCLVETMREHEDYAVHAGRVMPFVTTVSIAVQLKQDWTLVLFPIHQTAAWQHCRLEFCWRYGNYRQ